VILLVVLVAVGGGLAFWKAGALRKADEAARNQPEPTEAVTVAVAQEREHRHSIISIGTVVALRSITLRNELPGTVREVHLTPGQVVEAGTLLVALDVSVEDAELKAQKAQAALAQTLSDRMQRAVTNRATSQMEADRARAELDVAKAQMNRLEAIIARKTIRAPFHARIGLSDVHPGQFLEEGTLITSLQGMDEATQVDFAVPQQVAQSLKQGDMVELISGPTQITIPAEIVALDARVDPRTRNTTVRARIATAENVPPPGASVRVRVPAGAPMKAVGIPVNALRKGPEGDHVFVIAPDGAGTLRAEVRPVQTGAMLGEEALVLSGVSAGDRVAAQGSFKLRDKVQVVIASTNTVAARN
jgi:membrane fusion protein (multidrug efflux system)